MQNKTASLIIGFPHSADVLISVAKSLNGSILGSGRCAHDAVLVNLDHLLHDFSRSAGVAKAPSCHSISLGEAVDNDGSLLHAGKSCDGNVLFAPIGQLSVNLVRRDDEVVFFNNRDELLQVRALHDGTRRVVREGHDQNLGLRRNGCFQFFRRQAELILFLELDGDRYAVRHNDTRFVGYVGGLRDQNLIAGVNHGTHRQINGLRAAHCDKNF